MEEKILCELKRLALAPGELIDRKCIGLNPCSVIFLDTQQEYNLTGNQNEEKNYFERFHSVFDPYWAGCYIRPGAITTIREIHTTALLNMLRSNLVERYFTYHFDKVRMPDELRTYYEEYIPELIICRIDHAFQSNVVGARLL